MPYNVIAEITDIHPVADDTFRIVMDAPEIAEEAEPGQFAMVGFPTPSYDPFLRRPLAFAGAEWERIEFLVRVAGWGTGMLSNTIPGQELPVLGPLGNPFPRPKNGAILVAGGIGLPPLLFASTRWNKSVLLYGEKAESAVYRPPDNSHCEMRIITENGGKLENGLVTDLLERQLDRCLATVYCCGPVAMLKKAVEVCRDYGVKCYVSLEERMACGVGACQGCVVPTKEGYWRVCKDGPVFDAELIDWEALRG